MVIDRATACDRDALLAFLEHNGLPADGVTEHLTSALVGRQQDRIVASAALELYDDAALLRSVAVDAALRGTGVGHQLTHAALDMARRHGVTDVFLLTTTAETFFPRFGFERIDRDAVPAAVRASVEFTSACPTSAVVMRKHLAAPR